MRVVLDTNVWLSAMLWGGLPEQILQRVESQDIQAIGSVEILNELESTLLRAKFHKRLNQIGLNSGEIIAIVRQTMTIVAVEAMEFSTLRDPKDAIIIATAISSGSEIIISGDQDLLILEKCAGIRILSPKDFLAQY